MKWHILDSGKASAAYQMELDAHLLKNLTAHSSPLIRFYEWERESVTHGYFIKPEKYLNIEAIKKYHLELARRPTGGGIVVHSKDFSFSILIPAAHGDYRLNTLNNYKYINSIVLEVIRMFLGQCFKVELLDQDIIQGHSCCQNFCMAHPVRFDIMVNHSKVGGGAQRRTKAGYLHQGTINLKIPPEHYLKDLLVVPQVVNDIQKGFSLVDESGTEKQCQEAKNQLKNLFLKVIGK